MASQVYGLASSFTVDDFHAAKKAWSARLLVPSGRLVAFDAVSTNPEDNVVGVAIGEKLTDGQHTGTAALKFLVRRKFAEHGIPAGHLLPQQVDGVPVDVEEVGQLRAQQVAVAAAIDPRTRIRPVQPGCSVGFKDPQQQFVMAGTCGALVTDHVNRTRALLSNSHVLADEGRLSPGSSIFQPGLLDAPHTPGSEVATLTRAVPLVPPPAMNQVDAAIASLLDQQGAVPDILQIGPPAGTRPAAMNLVVEKFGRTTSFTVGTISSIAADVKVGYETGEYLFEDQIIIVGLRGNPFSAAGDSGSLIVERQTRKAVGLLFAGSSSHTIANHIGTVLTALDIALV